MTRHEQKHDSTQATNQNSSNQQQKCFNIERFNQLRHQS